MSGSRTTYKKPTRVYDYNYNLGEHYYKPQLRHADLRFHGRAGSPPRAKTFAERFAADPVYGSYGTSGYGSARKSSLTDDLLGRPTRSEGRFAPRSGLSEDTDFRSTRFGASDDFGEFGKSRFSFGDRLLDAAGTKFGAGESKAAEEAFDEKFFQTRDEKRFGRDAKAMDFGTEDRFKSKSSRRFDTAVETADEMMDDMKREAEKFGETSKLRSKIRTSRLQQDNMDFGPGNETMPESTEARIEKIRARAKARIAEAMEDSDFAHSAPVSTKSYFDDFDSSGGGSKSVRISKKSLKTTFDID